MRRAKIPKQLQHLQQQLSTVERCLYYIEYASVEQYTISYTMCIKPYIYLSMSWNRSRHHRIGVRCTMCVSMVSSLHTNTNAHTKASVSTLHTHKTNMCGRQCETSVPSFIIITFCCARLCLMLWPSRFAA